MKIRIQKKRAWTSLASMAYVIVKIYTQSRQIFHYEDPGTTRRLKEVLVSCPNLEILHLRIPRIDGRAEWQSDHRGAFDLCAEPGDQLPPLRELVFESRWEIGFQPFVPNTFWNWSRIRHLELCGLDMAYPIVTITGQIKYLQTLIIESLWGHGTLP
jgi:hypothetical protein